MRTHSSPQQHAHTELAKQYATERNKTQTLLALAQAPTPQQMVEVLVDYFMEADIRICSMWLCGPTKPEYAYTRSDYIELAGIWGQGVSPGVGIGTQVRVPNSTSIQHLMTKQPLHSGMLSAKQANQDALLATLRKTSPTVHWLVLPLFNGQRCCGLLFFGLERNAAKLVLGHLQELLPIANLAASQYVLQQEQITSRYERMALLNAVKDGILLAHAAPGGSTVLMANERFRRLFNCYTPLAGVSLAHLLEHMQAPPSVKQRLGAAWRGISQDAMTVERGSFEMVTHEGRPVEIAWYAAPMVNTESDEVFAHLFIFHDATSEHAAKHVRSAFLSRVSHELRTPLTSISGFAEVILDDDEMLPGSTREYVEIIHQSAGKLKTLFTELIEITRAEVGQTPLHLRRLSLEDTVQSVVRTFASAAAQRQQSVRVTQADDLPQVSADGERVERVLQSLVGNAVQYAPEGGNITVSVQVAATLADLPAAAPADVMLPAVLVSVIDDGDGVQAEDAAHVFEPFYRSKTTLARQIEGTGLGLAFARSVMELHRGNLWVQPATKQAPGGRFHLTLPVAN